MIRREVTVNCVGGLDARPIAMLVQKASQFESNVYIEILDQINAKSIMGMMSLNISDGEAVTVVTDGEDEQEAASAIEEYLSKQ